MGNQRVQGRRLEGFQGRFSTLKMFGGDVGLLLVGVGSDYASL